MPKISHEAERAFNEEVLPRIIAPIMEKAKREIGEAMEEISVGHWPSKNVEYSVMRHKPMRMMSESFTDEILDAFIEWTRGKF